MLIPTDWTFKNAEVAAGFDQHVREQLPWYDLITGLVTHIVRHYLPENGVMYDIGASTGNIGRGCGEVIASRKASFIPIDSSEEMQSVYSGPGKLVIADATEFDFGQFDVAVLFLCLMFIPVPKRMALIAKLKSQLLNGGAIIIIDKLEPHQGYLGQVLHRLTIAGKVATGCKAQDIVAKELSLSGVQRPVTMAQIGNAKEVFRFGEFAGWVLENEVTHDSASVRQ